MELSIETRPYHNWSCGSSCDNLARWRFATTVTPSTASLKETKLNVETERKKNSRRFNMIRRFFVASNATETMYNEMTCFIIYCLNCIRCDQNPKYETYDNSFYNFIQH